jgi:hypothetical protein
MSDTDTDTLPRMDRRGAIQWMLGAATAIATRDARLLAADASAAPITAKGYGIDPSMVKIYKPGDVWPLTLTEPQRHTTRALCDIIVPADDTSPSASAVGVPDFMNEWISAPYPEQAKDRTLLLDGLRWIEEEAQRRHQAIFTDLSAAQQTGFCEIFADPAKAKTIDAKAAAFFKRFRDLAFGAWCTTPEGMKAIGYVGNVPSAIFAGPPPEALKHVGLA